MAKNKLPMRGNILSIISMSFCLILLVTSSPAFSSTMKGSITINNPEEKFFSDSSLHLIYIKAFNCKFSEKFSEEAIPNFKKTKLASKIYFTTIEVDDFRVPYESTAWPAYLKWVLKKAKFENCGPQFIAIKGHTILGIICNIKGFQPALKLLKSHLN